MLFRPEAEFAGYARTLQLLNSLGVGGKVLTPEAARAVEPALGAGLRLHSAVYFPTDEIGNCRQFAHLAKDKLLQAGAKFHFDTPVTAITSTSGLQIHTREKGTFSFEQVVICAGAGATSPIAPGRHHLPLNKIWSTSVSAQIREPLNAPRSAVLDWQQQVSISRMGSRLRVSGGAELGNRAAQSSGKTSQRLFQALQSHFPGAADYSRSMQVWQGASIFSPDALPLVGPGAIPKVWLNIAHGHNGWSMACGTARVLADLIGG